VAILRDGELLLLEGHALKRLKQRKHLYLECGPLPEIDLISLVQKAWDNCADGIRMGRGYLMIKEVGVGEVAITTYTPSPRRDQVVI